ncbi:hypothetical protein IJ579_01525 [bacterium]|nr:hypothetical protein [bacterium]
MGLSERFSGKLNTEKLQTQQPTKNIIEDEYKKFEDLETDAINKIRKTPHWQEYPLKTQENMIAKYFDNKIKNRYINISYTNSEKIGFIKNILTLANNR